MRNKTIIATPVADLIILIGETKRVRVLVNSTILRDASWELNELLGHVKYDAGSEGDDTNNLPTFRLRENNVAAATLVLRFLHPDYDKSDTYDCSVILDLTSLVDEYGLHPVMKARLENIIGIKSETSDDAEDLCYLLIAAYKIKATLKFQNISAKLIRFGPAASFYQEESKLQLKRAQIDAKLTERVLQVTQELKQCTCIVKPSCSGLILNRVMPCTDTKDGRTPQQRMDQLQLARDELGRLKEATSQEESSDTHRNALVRHAQQCLGHAIQDIRQLCHEGVPWESVCEWEDDSDAEYEEDVPFGSE
ncbi:hypothetical protein F5X68DRAFT_243010 [Plectosphaerella plurivora]|uniref:BTB domain-containing protein n=1 Tax=Plectosphaerella plurivora TaxID=936078 RepID=A0A9P9AAG4_9PEZI|nr:hypothetical protein F5X68DRAFT_243010 [Plectosphaerella plurivora]